MKKVVLSLAFVAAVLVSCNKKGTEGEATADSTAVDTTAVVADTTAVVADTAAVKTDSVAKTEEVKKEEK